MNKNDLKIKYLLLCVRNHKHIKTKHGGTLKYVDFKLKYIANESTRE